MASDFLIAKVDERRQLKIASKILMKNDFQSRIVCPKGQLNGIEE